MRLVPHANPTSKEQVQIVCCLMHLSIETPTPLPRGSMGHWWGLLRVLAPFVSEGVGDLLFFVASVLPMGWRISKVLTFVDEQGLR